MKAFAPLQPDTAQKPPRFADALAQMLRHPQEVLRLWNWKAAVLSVILRGPIFFVAGIRRGWQAAATALFTETVFCVLSAGFYGAVVQSLKDAEPEWLTAMFLTVAMPAIFQVLEYLLHWFQGTPHLRVAGIVSLVVSGISALFNWYAMRRGTLLVGGEGGGFGRDLLRLPRLLFGFLTSWPRAIFRRTGPHNRDAEQERPNQPLRRKQANA